MWVPAKALRPTLIAVDDSQIRGCFSKTIAPAPAAAAASAASSPAPPAPAMATSTSESQRPESDSFAMVSVILVAAEVCSRLANVRTLGAAVKVGAKMAARRHGENWRNIPRQEQHGGKDGRWQVLVSIDGADRRVASLPAGDHHARAHRVLGRHRGRAERGARGALPRAHARGGPSLPVRQARAA